MEGRTFYSAFCFYCADFAVRKYRFPVVGGAGSWLNKSVRRSREQHGFCHFQFSVDREQIRIWLKQLINDVVERFYVLKIEKHLSKIYEPRIMSIKFKSMVSLPREKIICSVA